MISSDWRNQIFEKEKKKNCSPNLGPEAFRNFIEFGSLVYLQIAYLATISNL